MVNTELIEVSGRQQQKGFLFQSGLNDRTDELCYFLLLVCG